MIIYAVLVWLILTIIYVVLMKLNRREMNNAVEKEKEESVKLRNRIAYLEAKIEELEDKTEFAGDFPHSPEDSE